MANEMQKKLSAFMDSPKREQFLEKLSKDIQKERDSLHQEPTDDKFFSENTLWRKMRLYIDDKVIPFYKEIVGEIPGSKEVLELIEANQAVRVQNIENAILEDCHKNYSSHDIIRARL